LLLSTNTCILRHIKGDFLSNRNYGNMNNGNNSDWNNGFGDSGNSLYGMSGTMQSGWNGQMQNMSQTAMLPSVEVRTGTPQAISIYSAEESMPETMTNTAYIPAYLRHQIGRWMRIEFLIGNILEEKVGQLLDVGASYIILKMLEPSTTMLCDLYSIKFITIIYDVNLERLYTR